MPRPRLSFLPSPSSSPGFRSATLAPLAAGLALLLTGCGIGPIKSASLASSPATSGTAEGSLHGGQQIVIGAHIYLFAAASNGYGAASLSLMNPAHPGVFSDQNGSYVLTDANGNFHLTGTYTCSPGQLLYLVAQGGNPGFASGVNNPALTMIDVVGACTASAGFPIPFVNLNEVTTVAAAYALAGYMTDPFHLSSPATPLAQQGITNAFLTVSNLVDAATGVAGLNTAGGNGVAPQPTVNTIANMLAACINSAGTTSACTTLFSNTQDSNGVPPTDTASAALNLAHHPGANVVALFNLAVPTPPFQPSLTRAPNDWTVAITYYADLMAGPYYPAFDAAGNLWVPGFANNTLTEFDPRGIPLSGAAGFAGNDLNQPFAVAIDAAQGPWVGSYAYGVAANVSHFNANGSSGGSFACGTNCTGVAIDALQNIWTAAASGSTALRNVGTPMGQFKTTATAPGIALDSAGRAWTLATGRSLLRLTLPGTVDTFPQTVTSTAANDLNLLAIDAADNIWFTSGKNNALGRFDSTGKLVSPASGYTGGGLNYPAQVAIDGANQVWVANRDGNSVSAFHNDGTPITSATGYQPSGQAAPDATVPVTASGVRSPHGLAIDGSGNLWVTNFTANSVTEFVGLATPSVTPISPTTHGQRP